MMRSAGRLHNSRYTVFQQYGTRSVRATIVCPRAEAPEGVSANIVRLQHYPKENGPANQQQREASPGSQSSERAKLTTINQTQDCKPPQIMTPAADNLQDGRAVQDDTAGVNSLGSWVAAAAAQASQSALIEDTMGGNNVSQVTKLLGRDDGDSTDSFTNETSHSTPQLALSECIAAAAATRLTDTLTLPGEESATDGLHQQNVTTCYHSLVVSTPASLSTTPSLSAQQQFEAAQLKSKAPPAAMPVPVAPSNVWDAMKTQAPNSASVTSPQADAITPTQTASTVAVHVKDDGRDADSSPGSVIADNNSPTAVPPTSGCPPRTNASERLEPSHVTSSVKVEAVQLTTGVNEGNAATAEFAAIDPSISSSQQLPSSTPVPTTYAGTINESENQSPACHPGISSSQLLPPSTPISAPCSDTPRVLPNITDHVEDTNSNSTFSSSEALPHRSHLGSSSLSTHSGSASHAPVPPPPTTAALHPVTPAPDVPALSQDPVSNDTRAGGLPESTNPTPEAVVAQSTTSQVPNGTASVSGLDPAMPNPPGNTANTSGSRLATSVITHQPLPGPTRLTRRGGQQKKRHGPSPVVVVRSEEDFVKEVEEEKARPVVLYISHKVIIHSGVVQEAEIHWKTDPQLVKKKKLAADLVTVLDQCALGTPQVKFVHMVADTPALQSLCKELEVPTYPSLQFWKNGEFMWDCFGVFNIQRGLSEGLLYYADTAGNGVKVSSFVPDLHNPQQVKSFVSSHADQSLTVVGYFMTSLNSCVHVFPAMYALAKAHPDVSLARVFGDAGDEIWEYCLEIGLVQAPTFVFYKMGEEVGRFVGGSRADLIGQVLKYLVPSEVCPATEALAPSPAAVSKLQPSLVTAEASRAVAGS